MTQQGSRATYTGAIRAVIEDWHINVHSSFREVAIAMQAVQDIRREVHEKK